MLNNKFIKKVLIFNSILIFLILISVIYQSINNEIPSTLFWVGRVVVILSIAVMTYFIWKWNQRTQGFLQQSVLNEALMSSLDRNLIGTYVIQDNKVVRVNKQFSEIFGMDAEYIYSGRFLEETYTTEQRDRLLNMWTNQLNGTEEAKVYTLKFDRNGETRIVEIFPEVIKLDGKPSIVGSVIDVTDREDLMRELDRSEQKYRSLFHKNPDAIYSITKEGALEDVNDALVGMFGYSKEELESMKFHPLVDPEYLNDTVHHFELALEGTPQNYYSRGVHRNGEIVELNLTNIPIYVDDKIVGIYGIAKDITAQRVAERQLEKMAETDFLTNLPNRYKFEEMLDKAINRAKQHRLNLSVLFIDYDDFKSINDNLGHAVGDELLIELSKRMATIVEGNGFLARQGGDEFIIYLEGLNRGEVHAFIEELQATVCAPMVIQGQDVSITPSIGIAHYPGIADDVEELIKHADLAMYWAKEKGRNTYSFYTEELDTFLSRRMLIQTHLKKGLEREQFKLVYQPQIDLQTNALIGVEALLRFEPGIFQVCPAEFIPIAEETGYIIPIGEWVLAEACRQLKKWQYQGMSSEVTMSVNVSARQFHHPDFARVVERVLHETGISPACLELEITESVMLDARIGETIMKQLKELGVRMSIDDFGAGHSSLNILRTIDIDTLKLDRSIVQNIDVDERMEVMVLTIMDLGKRMGAQVVIEGIETAEQAAYFRQHGVIGQGYYFSRPIKSEEIEEKWME